MLRRQKTTGMVWVVVVTILMVFGCDESQSPNVKFIQDIEVSLLFKDGTESPEKLDLWTVGKDNQTIWSANFGYVVKVIAYAEGVEVSAIRIDCYVEHCDPLGGSGDIWAMDAPNGEKYGYMMGWDSLMWDFDTGYGTAKTDLGGKAFIHFGLGNPAGAIGCAGYEWPPSCDLPISTGVKVKFVLQRYKNPIVKECHFYIVRNQCAGFWTSDAGVGGFDTSYSSTSPATDWTMPAGGEGSSEASQSGTEEFQETPIRYRPEVPVEKDDIRTVSSEGFEVTGWKQLVVDWDLNKWVWEDVNAPLNGLIAPDSNDPNDMISMLSLCEPYAFFCRVGSEDYNALEHTVILESKTSEGDSVSWLPLQMFSYDANYPPDEPNEIIVSEYVVPIDSPFGEGRCMDWYGWTGVFIYVPENGSLEVHHPDSLYGDFNFDNQIDYKDYASLAKQWYLGYQDESFNLKHDATLDGQIGEDDLAVFADNWLRRRADKNYGDFNSDGKVDNSDFAMFANHWGQCVSDEGYDEKYDAEGDGTVNGKDLNHFTQNWWR